MSGPASKIALLDESFRARIAALVKERVTYGQIADIMNGELEEAGFDIRLSTSGISRYGKNLKDAHRHMSETHAFARQLALDLGEKEGDQTFDLIVEMLSHLMFKLMRSHTIEEAKEAFSTTDFMKLTIAIKNLSDAKMRDLGYKREVRTEALREAATLSARVAKEQGLSAEAAGAIKAKILGLKS